MEKKFFRKKTIFFPQLMSGIFLCYVSIDNFIGGPLRDFLTQYFDLDDFGSNSREESLYYIIFFIGLFQIIISIQIFFQPVIEIKNGKIALKTKEKILSVIKDVDEVLDIKEQERDIINFIFQDKSYTVVIKHLNREELDPILKQIKSVNQE